MSAPADGAVSGVFRFASEQRQLQGFPDLEHYRLESSLSNWRFHDGNEYERLFAGIGTTFVVLAAGFGGGLMMAKSALKEPSSYQTRAAVEALAPVRVILPTSAEAAQPPQVPQQQASSTSNQLSATPPAQQLQTPAERQIEAATTSRSQAEERERKRRYAERKAKRQLEARARVQRELQQPREREDAPVLAFSSDSSKLGGGMFGN